ncbi:MAG: hypothetical protein ACK5PZ_21330, partial [Pirellula sp.]
VCSACKERMVHAKARRREGDPKRLLIGSSWILRKIQDAWFSLQPLDSSPQPRRTPAKADLLIGLAEYLIPHRLPLLNRPHGA